MHDACVRRLALCTLLSGCSFGFVHPPKPHLAPGQPLRCTTNAAPVIIDAVVAVAAGTALARTLDQPMPADEFGKSLRRAQQWSLGTVSAAAAVSAIYGGVMTDRCQRAFDRLR